MRFVQGRSQSIRIVLIGAPVSTEPFFATGIVSNTDPFVGSSRGCGYSSLRWLHCMCPRPENILHIGLLDLVEVAAPRYVRGLKDDAVHYRADPANCRSNQV